MLLRDLIDRMRAGLSAWRDAREIAQLRATSPEIAAALAREAGTVPAELEHMAAAGRRAARLRERMIQAFGISPDILSAADYGALRQTGIACSQCNAKRRCAIELQRGTARANAAGFCPNASTFAALTNSSRH